MAGRNVQGNPAEISNINFKVTFMGQADNNDNRHISVCVSSTCICILEDTFINYWLCRGAEDC